MDKFESIKAFTKVVETEGFAAAARELKMSRSSVSKHIASLESELGTQLLQRTTRQTITTDIGRAFYERCVRILSDLEEATLSVIELTDKPVGNLRVNAPMSFGTLHLSRVVAEFMRIYPDVHVELVLNDRFIDPIEEGFDVTVQVRTPTAAAGLVTKEIVSARRVICASPEYLGANAEPRHPNELINHRCLHYGNLESGDYWQLLDATEEAHTAPINCTMWSNNGEVLRDAAIADQGIALLPTFIVGNALQEGSLRSILTTYEPTPLTLCALYPHHRHLSVKVRLFVDMLVAHFSESPRWDLVQ